MSEFKQYIIAVTASAIVGSIAISISDKKTTTSAIIKFIVGIFVTLAIIKPLINFKITDISGYLGSIDTMASDCAQTGALWADTETAAIIKERSEAYILDKASSIGVQVDVDVSLNSQVPFNPTSVSVTGNVPPYIRTQLSESIEKDIGVSKENQIWIQ